MSTKEKWFLVATSRRLGGRAELSDKELRWLKSLHERFKLPRVEGLRNEYRDLRQAKALIGKFLENVSNEKRLHSARGYLPLLLNSKPISPPGETRWPLRGGFPCEFSKHQGIYRFDGDTGLIGDAPSHHLNKFPVGYSWASCTPALLASASPTVSDYVVMLSCWSTVFAVIAEQCLNWLPQARGKRRLLSPAGPTLCASENTTISFASIMHGSGFC